MIKLSVKSDIDRVVRRLTDEAKKQIPFATAVALTRTAKSVQKTLERRISRDFDRPRPWIQKSPFSERATKKHLSAVVGIRDKGARATPAKYLKEHFAGSSRGNKPMEKAMRAMGILPAGWLAVPSVDGVKKDAFGNVSKSTIARILGALKQGQLARSGKNTFRLFVVKPGAQRKAVRHLAPGIWSSNKIGGSVVLKPVFLFVESASYQKVIDLKAVADEVVVEEFPRYLRLELARAMGSSL